MSTLHTNVTKFFVKLIILISGIELMKENIIENIFYRFNPYFPSRPLPVYDINPADLDDFNVKLGLFLFNTIYNTAFLYSFIQFR